MAPSKSWKEMGFFTGAKNGIIQFLSAKGNNTVPRIHSSLNEFSAGMPFFTAGISSLGLTFLAKSMRQH